MYTRITEEGGFIGNLALLARLINRDLIGKVFVPTRALENEIGIDALFRDSREVFLIQLKVKEFDGDNLEEKYKSKHYQEQLENIKQVREAIMLRYPEIENITILGGLGGLGGSREDRWLQLYLGEYDWDELGSPVQQSWFAKGIQRIDTEDHHEFRKIIAKTQEIIAPIEKGEWHGRFFGGNILRRWLLRADKNIAILMTDKGVLIAGGIETLLKNNLREESNVTDQVILRREIFLYPVYILGSLIIVWFIFDIFSKVIPFVLTIIALLIIK